MRSVKRVDEFAGLWLVSQSWIWHTALDEVFHLGSPAKRAQT